MKTNASDGDISSPEVSVVMPCLNEADTLAGCISKAQRALRENNIVGEIIIGDNGSTDGSQAIAARMGARVINVSAKGYGNALMGGIAAAQGRFIIMGDADGSYDFLETPKFVEKLRQGFDLVQGCRLPSGAAKYSQARRLRRLDFRPSSQVSSSAFWGCAGDEFHRKPL